MFVVKDLIYGLGGETWEERVASFETEAEAEKFVEYNYTMDYYIEEED